MSSAAAVHARRLRKTKAELVSEIESLEVQLAGAGPANDAEAGDGRPLAPDHLAELANLTGECPYPVFRVTPDRRVLYANDAARERLLLRCRGLRVTREKER